MQVGDRVEAGQVLGEMDPVDLDERVQSQGATLRRVDAAKRVAEARQAYAQTQAQRYERLLAMRATSEELVTTKPQEQQIADAALAGARQDRSPANADREALLAQRSNLLLIAPVSRARHAAGGRSRHDRRRRRVIELIDPATLWINVRFDQASATGTARPAGPHRPALRAPLRR